MSLLTSGNAAHFHCIHQNYAHRLTGASSAVVTVQPGGALLLPSLRGRCGLVVTRTMVLNCEATLSEMQNICHEYIL